MPKLQDTDFILGFDFGMRRIGVAVGTRETQTAKPLTHFAATNGVPDWERVLKLIDEWEAKAIVVGHPLNMDGSTQNTSFAAKRFANKLADKCRLPAFLVDERLTTAEARHDMKEHNLAFNVDSYSAKLILEQWLRSEEDTWIYSQ